MRGARMFIVMCALLATARAQSGTPKVEVPFFGNSTCPVTGKPADPKISVLWQGERIFTCCEKCIVDVKTDPAAFHAKAYPKDKIVDVKNALCPIRGEPAKEDVTTVFQGRKVRFCCPGCDKAFRKEPNRHLALLTRKDLKAAGNAKCPVMGEDVTPDSFFTYGGRLIGICCADCSDEFGKDPAKYQKILDTPAGGPKDGDKKKPGAGHQHGGGQAPDGAPAPKKGGCCGSTGGTGHDHGGGEKGSGSDAPPAEKKGGGCGGCGGCGGSSGGAGKGGSGK